MRVKKIKENSRIAGFCGRAEKIQSNLFFINYIFFYWIFLTGILSFNGCIYTDIQFFR